jgi:hypothetical protein
LVKSLWPEGVGRRESVLPAISGAKGEADLS